MPSFLITALTSEARSQARLRAVGASLAVERYRIANHALPGNLSTIWRPIISMRSPPTPLPVSRSSLQEVGERLRRVQLGRGRQGRRRRREKGHHVHGRAVNERGRELPATAVCCSMSADCNCSRACSRQVVDESNAASRRAATRTPLLSATDRRHNRNWAAESLGVIQATASGWRYSSRGNRGACPTNATRSVRSRAPSQSFGRARLPSVLVAIEAKTR